LNNVKLPKCYTLLTTAINYYPCRLPCGYSR